MKKLLISFLVLFLALSQALAQTSVANNLANFNLIWQTVYENHYDPTFGGKDWMAIGVRHREAVVSARDRKGFQKAVNTMLFELGLSHLLVASEEMLKRNMPVLFAQGSPGIEIRWIDESAIITRVRSASAAESAGLRPGFAITRINGLPVRDLAGLAPVLPPYNDRYRQALIANFIQGHLDGPAGTSVDVVYADGHGTAHDTTLPRVTRGPGLIISEAMPPVFVEYEARRLPGDIGYVRFNHFAEPVERAFVNSLENLRDTRGMIFDLRGNPGGYFRIMDTIVAHLIEQQTVLYRFRLRDNDLWTTISPAARAYLKPVVVLMDETSMSCSEHFAACLQAVGRAVIIGRRSPGYLQGAKWKRLPNGLFLMHTFLLPLPADEKIVEGQGVMPDLRVALDRTALLDGRDTQLQAAVDYLSGPH